MTEISQNGMDLYGYWIPERRGFLPPSMVQRYGLPSTIENLPEFLLARGSVGPDSFETWKNLFAAMERGDKGGCAPVTLKTENGVYKRFWMRFSGIPDEQGNPLWALISFDDVMFSYEYRRSLENDINALLEATEKIFPRVTTLNLTRNTCRMIRNDDAMFPGQDYVPDMDAFFPSQPKEISIDDMLNRLLERIVPNDRESFRACFARERLEKEFSQKGDSVLRLSYRRFRDDGQVRWLETMIMRQKNSLNDDLLVVAMTRDVGAQKAEEDRLREQLWQQTEELRLTMSRMGKIINYYHVDTGTFVMSQSIADKYGIPHVMKGFPESFIAAAPKVFSPKALETIKNFYNDIRQGKAAGVCEYRMKGKEGQDIWMNLEFVTIFDDEKRPVRAVIAAEDVTRTHIVASETRRLKYNEKILGLLNQHSDRVVIYFDMETNKVCFWDGELEMSDLSDKSADLWHRLEDVSGMIRNVVERMMGNIRNGIPNGEEKLRLTNENNERQWLDVKYSTLYDDEEKPIAALFSYKDITGLYDRELAYQRHIQSMESADNHSLLEFECDLTTDSVERLNIQRIALKEGWTKRSYSEFCHYLLAEVYRCKEREEMQRYFSCENLMELYREGNRRLIRHWYAQSPSGGMCWLSIEMALVADSYTNHVKGFFRMVDVTEKKERRMKMEYRSERDGMTGLLNRETAERKIRSKIDHGEMPGILLLLDLDDLKGINDTLGHSEGDRAIRGIADTLKSYFREDDIIGRFGGDEFIVYLPGAAPNSKSIAVSIAVLLRKLANISIGANNERRIHASVGCAVQNSEMDTFESLYKRADIALYYVKRAGKNNFAFHSQEMDQKNAKFLEENQRSLRNSRTFDIYELQQLMSSFSAVYVMIMSANLSTNDYFLMEVDDGPFAKEPVCGDLDGFLQRAEKRMHPEDVEFLKNYLSRESLLDAYGQGKKSLRYYLRFLDGDQYRWIKVTILFHINECGDVCMFVLLRWPNDLEKRGLEVADAGDLGMHKA